MGEREPGRSAWEPLTVRGAAAFAHGSFGRLALVQAVFALVAALVLGWFFYADWFPIIARAIRQLPPTGELRNATLNWSGPSPVVLADNHFLAFSVDLDHVGGARAPAQLLVELGRHDLYLHSLLGYLRVPYLPGYIVSASRTDLEPWWGAWRPAVLAMILVGSVGFLFTSWWLLSTAYALPAWMLAFYLNRSLSLWGGWKLAGACLMPGALFFTVAIALYALGFLDLLHMAVALALHFLAGWTYLVLTIISLPRVPGMQATRGNPFQANETGERR